MNIKRKENIKKKKKNTLKFKNAMKNIISIKKEDILKFKNFIKNYSDDQLKKKNFKIAYNMDKNELKKHLKNMDNKIIKYNFNPFIKFILKKSFKNAQLINYKNFNDKSENYIKSKKEIDEIVKTDKTNIKKYPIKYFQKIVIICKQNSLDKKQMQNLIIYLFEQKKISRREMFIISIKEFNNLLDKMYKSIEMTELRREQSKNKLGTIVKNIKTPVKKIIKTKTPVKKNTKTKTPVKKL